MSKNPYRLSTTQSVQVRISKTLLRKINKYTTKLQKEADLKHGRGKHTVSKSYASKKLAERINIK